MPRDEPGTASPSKATPFVSSSFDLGPARLTSPVTGGCGTLALEAARALLEHGASGVALFDIDPAHAEPEMEKLRKDFPDQMIIAKKVDVTKTEQVEAAVKETAESLGSVDILACFAGVVGCTHALDMSADEWRKVMDINSTGAFLCAQAVARYAEPSTRHGMTDRLNFPGK